MEPAINIEGLHLRWRAMLRHGRKKGGHPKKINILLFVKKTKKRPVTTPVILLRLHCRIQLL